MHSIMAFVEILKVSCVDLLGLEWAMVKPYGKSQGWRTLLHEHGRGFRHGSDIRCGVIA